MRWKALSIEEKAPYQALALADKTRYLDETAVYKEKIITTVSTIVGDGDGDVCIKKELKKKTKKSMVKDKPKRAKSSYLFFMSDYRRRLKEENPYATSTEISKELGWLCLLSVH